MLKYMPQGGKYKEKQENKEKSLMKPTFFEKTDPNNPKFNNNKIDLENKILKNKSKFKMIAVLDLILWIVAIVEIEILMLPVGIIGKIMVTSISILSSILSEVVIGTIYSTEQEEILKELRKFELGEIKDQVKKLSNEDKETLSKVIKNKEVINIAIEVLKESEKRNDKFFEEISEITNYKDDEIKELKPFTYTKR